MNEGWMRKNEGRLKKNEGRMKEEWRMSEGRMKEEWRKNEGRMKEEWRRMKEEILLKAVVMTDEYVKFKGNEFFATNSNFHFL